MFREDKVSADAVADGAITDADQLKGMVARNDVYPGEQLTTNQFQRSDTTNVAVKLQPDQRAIAFPVDPASGLIGQLQSGDHVDVVATFDVLPVGKNGVPLTGAQAIPLTRTIVSNALVLTAPAASSGTTSAWRLGARPVAHAGDRDRARELDPLRPAEGLHLVRAAPAGLGARTSATRSSTSTPSSAASARHGRRCCASRERIDDRGHLHTAQHRGAPRLPERPPRRRDAERRQRRSWSRPGCPTSAAR